MFPGKQVVAKIGTLILIEYYLIKKPLVQKLNMLINDIFKIYNAPESSQLILFAQDCI